MDIGDLMDDNKIREAQSFSNENEEQEKPDNGGQEDFDIEGQEKVESGEQEEYEDVITDGVELDNEPKNVALSDESVRKYITEQREKNEDSFSDYFNPEIKEVEKNVNPYEDVFDENDKKYFDFKKETNLGREEFDFVQQDFSKKSPLELAQESVRRSSDVKLTTEEINSYLEKKLQVDLSSDELDRSDEIELSDYSKPLRQELLSQQEKYKATVSEKRTPVQQVEMVKLEGGEEMPKAKYEELVQQRETYVNGLKEGVSSATSFDVDISFDNNGDKQTAKFNYDYSEDDRHSMVSNASDVNTLIASKFKTDKGFDYKGLASFVDKAMNFDKYIGLAYKEAQAQALEGKIASDNNEQFNSVPKSSRQKEAKDVDSLIDLV
jgi:hypothetical protein